MARNQGKCAFVFTAAMLCLTASAEAATIYVAAGGDLQRALNAAQPGDTVLVEANAEFVGNFVLPVKTGDAWITLRSATPDGELPLEGTRIQPADATRLARLRSPNSSAALRTAPGAHHWALRYLEFPATKGGNGDILQIGDGSAAQNTLARVPHHFVLRHVYVHGDPLVGQKRGIALNAAHVTIADSFVSECKGIGQDTQAIGGWNGPGPYTIENNYLEAAGENVMFGGADPAIADLVADGITFRRNYLSRPMSWRNPLVAAPKGLTAAAADGGSLAAGAYGYRVIARRPVQGTVARSAASAEIVVTTTTEGAVRLTWQAVAGAAEYRVYGRTSGGENLFWRVTGTEFVDTGAAGTSEAVPASAGAVWSVKNVFELKNARHVVVEENIFENHWKESQPGYAIVLTPRNSQGACTWCVVEHVRFERNVVRNAAAGVNILGYDSGYPSKQAADIIFRQNLFGLSTTLGGNGWFMLVGDGPRGITIDHNTIDSNGNSVVYAYGGTATDPREIQSFRFSANAARHATYGVNGQGFPYGNAVIGGFFPDGVFEANYLAGGSPARLPAGTLVANSFEDQFVDALNKDYTLRAGTVLHGAASDSSDIGVQFPELMKAIDGVEEGRPAGSDAAPVPPTAALEVSCTYLGCDFADTSAPGSRAIASRAWSFGDGSAIQNGPASGTHEFALGGTYVISVVVQDVKGLSSTAATTVHVTAQVHAAYSGTTTRWSSASGSTQYWSAEIVVLVHDADERPAAGATVTAVWSGAVAKTVTVVTDASGRAVLKSGTLSYGRSTVTLKVTAAEAANSVYDNAANHDAAGARTTGLTMIRP
jgi:hypothetical protein